MEQAFGLAKKAMGKTNPNPMVGAVIVKDGKIIGTGFHEKYGEAHAEVNALKEAGAEAKGAEIYVTLEPCSHYGKTPPCAEALVKAGIKKVYIAMRDPNPLVAGNGIKILKENGIEVVEGVLEEKARKLNEIFMKYITTKEPFVIMKTAMSLDGKIATKHGESKWITDEASRHYVHELRNKLMGIMVGINTIITDDPLLTTRLDDSESKSPTAIIVDSKLRIPLEAKILATLNQRKVIVATVEGISKTKEEQLLNKGIIIIKTPEKNGRVDLKYLMGEIGKLGIDSILLEGGSTINFSALEQGIVDKVMCFIAPKIIGGEASRTPVGGEGIEKLEECFKVEKMKVKQFNKDLLIEGYIRKEHK